MAKRTPAPGRTRHYWTDASLAWLRPLLVDAGKTQAEAAKTMGLSVNQIQRGAMKLGLAQVRQGGSLEAVGSSPHGLSMSQKNGLKKNALAAGAKAGGLQPLPFPPHSPPPPTPPLGQRCAHVTVTGSTVERCSDPCAKGSPWCRKHTDRFRAKRPARRKEDAA